MMSMFTDDILPVIGHLRMDDVEPMALLKVIRLFEDRVQWNALTRRDAGAGSIQLCDHNWQG
jgi:hypothetical protein